MRRGLGFSLIGLAVLGALASLAGCGRTSLFMAEREDWRHEAEVQCLKSGAIRESAALVRINPIDGPGICGADFPLKVAALGANSALGFADGLRPPGLIPRVGGSAQPRWPGSPSPYPAPVASQPMAPPNYPAPRTSDAYVPPAGGEHYLRAPGAGASQGYVPSPSAVDYARPPAARGYEPPTAYHYPPQAAPAPRHAAPPMAHGAPMRIAPPGIAETYETDTGPEYPPDRNAVRSYPPDNNAVRSYPPDRPAYSVSRPNPALRDRPAYNPPPDHAVETRPASAPLPALGPARGPLITGAIPAVEIKPNATLACPIVSALDQWITQSVQPSALRWFGQPVTEITQISAYSCRGMNGQVGARISEHAFGNALDIASFTLADGRKVVVRTAWNGPPEEQGFLRDIQSAACNQFNTVLAPGSNRFHYDHIHVDLMRRPSRRSICQPAAMSGEVAARAAQQSKYARRGTEAATTGSIASRKKLADEPYEDDDHQWIDPDALVERQIAPAAPVKVERMRDW